MIRFDSLCYVAALQVSLFDTLSMYSMCLGTGIYIKSTSNTKEWYTYVGRCRYISWAIGAHYRESVYDLQNRYFVYGNVGVWHCIIYKVTGMYVCMYVCTYVHIRHYIKNSIHYVCRYTNALWAI